jgi:hypothetical protein
VRKLATGTMVWDRVTNSCAPASVLVIDELVISSQCGQNLAEALKANHLTTGARAWSRPGAWQIQRGNLRGATGGHLYATDPSGAIVDLNPATGTTRHTLAGSPLSPIRACSTSSGCPDRDGCESPQLVWRICC